MSLLIADYGSSSDEEDSDNEEQPSAVSKLIVKPPSPSSTSSTLDPASKLASTRVSSQNYSSKNSIDSLAKPDEGSISDSDDSFAGHISDEDEDESLQKSVKHKDDTSIAPSSSMDADIIGLSGIGLSLPKPRNASTDASSRSTSDLSSSRSTSSILGSALPTPKAETESSVGAPDEELEDFVKPRDWEVQEAEKNKSMKASNESATVVSTKSKGGKVKISIPSLRDLDDEDEEEVADAGLRNDVNAKSKTGSGLFGLLPKPKNISETKMEKRPLIPHVLTKKPTPNPTVKTQPPKRPAEVPTEQQESNFFSLGDDEKLPQASFSSSSFSSSTLSKRLHVSHPDPEEYP